jgi:phytoene synthase
VTSPEDQLARQILAHHSKSFALAGRLLPAWCRQEATALYAWCRRCDDAVDVPAEESTRRTAVGVLRQELDAVYGGAPLSDPVLVGFRSVVRRRDIPRRYAEDLLDGMAMDIGTVRYRTFDDLLLYCYRVAGTVGLMMAHLMNVRDPSALRRAADLGMAMQLTNICRDVAEDQQRGRTYLPDEFLCPGGGPTQAVAELLRRAARFYTSGDRGLARLPMRCAVAIRAARLIYADIGRVLARRGFDVTAGRAVVSRRRKLWLLGWAALTTLPAILATPWRRDVRPDPLPFALPLEAEPPAPLGFAGPLRTAGEGP